jgi:alpha-ketoglutarate-dependent taurine dioxygenase
MEVVGSCSGPHTITPVGRDWRLAEFIAGEANALSGLLLEHGALLFRGFDVTAPADFQASMDALGARAMNYTYRSTPRTSLERNIFTATEYPKQLEIPLHSENAYQRAWPMWVVLCCITPASNGGQTPLANLAEVTAKLGRELVDRFARKGVKYSRTYRPYVDLQWQDVFQTQDRSEVARICDERGIDHVWLDAETLQTTQVCQGVARHPDTGRMLFFNQAHLFHLSALGDKAAGELVSFFGKNRLPRNAQYGDGSEIDPRDLEQVRRTFAAAVDLQWEAGDVALVDNMQFAHGRRAFNGPRKVLAALLNEFTPSPF